MILLFGLGFFLGLLVLAGSTAQPVLAESTYQDNPCAGLTPEKIRAGGVTVLQCKLHCQEILPAGDPNSWSDEELWTCINQSGSQSGDDVPPVIQDDQSGDDVPPIIQDDQSELNSACSGVTPEDFRIGSLESVVCRTLCSEPGWQSDEELWACIEYYGGQPGGDQSGGDVPIFPEDQITDDQPANLGPLATTPIVPLAGALIGTVIGWLVSVAATSGNVLKTLVTAPPAQPPSSAGVPPINNMNEQGLYWSERPGDEAGPGYVSKEEYEQTKAMLERGYKWTNGGWQAPEEIQQSEQWQQNDRAATSREDARLRAQIEQDRLNAARPQPVVSEQIEPPVQENQEDSPFVFELGVEGALSGDQGSSRMTPGVGANIGLYKNQWYDAKDLAGDVKLGGMDIGNYKADLQMGKVQAGAGVSYDAEGNAYSAGASFSASTYQLTGESVLGNKYLGATADAQIDGPKMEAVAGYKDGSIGASIGGSLVSTEVGVGMNVANVNVGVRGGLSFGLELGLTVGKETELKLGPFKLALSLGAAKTGL